MKVYVLSYNECVPWEQDNHGNLSVRAIFDEAYADYQLQALKDKENNRSKVSMWYIETFDLETGQQTDVMDYPNPNWYHKGEW
jgi:hypothetical protein